MSLRYFSVADGGVKSKITTRIAVAVQYMVFGVCNHQVELRSNKVRKQVDSNVEY